MRVDINTFLLGELPQWVQSYVMNLSILVSQNGSVHVPSDASKGTMAFAGIGNKDITKAIVKAAVVTPGLTISDYPIFLKVPNQFISLRVPEGLPGRYNDDNTPKTWEEWGVSENYTNPIITTDNFSVLRTNINGVNLTEPEMAILFELDNQNGFEVFGTKELNDFQQTLPNPEP